MTALPVSAAISGRHTQVSVVHGPDRHAVTPQSGLVPFHGIVSRGLGDRMSPEEWTEVATRIETTSWGDEALSYNDSMSVARAYLDDRAAHILDRLRCHEAVERWELWSCKEGHTASIWCATAFLADGAPPVRFCLNIARDTEAAIELRTTADILEDLARRDPNGVIQILDRKEMNTGRKDPVPVIATNWINGWELQALSESDEHGHGRLVAVARFLFSDGDPVRIARVAGFAVDATRGWARILHHWIRCCDWNRGEGNVAMPSFEIQEGDWMLAGDDVVLCAASAETRIVEPAAAIWACLLIHARRPGQRTYWGNAAGALAVLTEIGSSAGPLLAQGLAQAPQLGVEALRRQGLLVDARGEEIVSAAQRLFGGA